MYLHRSRQRIFASLLILGGGFLLTRTLIMIAQNALQILTPWVAGLLILEMIVDVFCLILCIRWLVREDYTQVPGLLTSISAVVVIHAIRVLIFIVGRIGPWYNFDVNPEFLVEHESTWSWSDVYIAGTLATASVVALIAVYLRLMSRPSVGQ